MVTKNEPLAPSSEREIARLLLHWYNEFQRPLPWRLTKDPYKIWASEIILQQTRVDQGTAYYLRFVERFPNVASLAEAEVDDVLREWQGLGYYSRARNFHKAAQLVQNEMNGELPTNYAQWRKLPGIGDYTAAAISSIAGGERQAVVDGNVIRLLSRLYDVDQAVNEAAAQSFFKRKAGEILEIHDPGTLNQALMEFGSLRCKPTNPFCEDCILSIHCLARARGTEKERPIKASSKKPGSEKWSYLVIHDPNGEVLLRRRALKGIWGGLYEFPLVSDFPEFRVLPEPAQRLEHRLSHLKLELEFYFLDMNAFGHFASVGEFRKVGRQERATLGFPKPMVSILELLDRRLGAL